MTLALHIVSSTIVLAIAMLAARALPMTARSRHALVAIGLAKFAVPAAAITAPLAMFGWSLGQTRVNETALRVFGATTAPLATTPLAPRVNWESVLLVAWAAVAFALLLLWSLRRHRLITLALRVAAQPSARELEALDAACEATGLCTLPTLLRSAIAEAPAVLRVVRPVIVLPARGCDELSDAELRSLMAHECAHIVRRDNLVGSIESFAAAALWFHPLVWLAQRQLAAAREEACDELVAESGAGVDTYAGALVKICHAAIAPRVAGVSCMAGATLKERLDNLMRYDEVKKRALPHRRLVTFAAITLLSFTATAATIDAPKSPRNDPFEVHFDGRDLGNGQIQADLTVKHRPTGELVLEPHVTFLSNDSAQVTSRAKHDGRMLDLSIELRCSRSGELMAFFLARDGKELVQRTLVTRQLPTGQPSAAKTIYRGEPITLSLSGADLRDVLMQFGTISGYAMSVAPDVEGKVTLNVVDMPWDEALQTIGRDTGTVFRVDGKTIHATKKR